MKIYKITVIFLLCCVLFAGCFAPAETPQNSENEISPPLESAEPFTDFAGNEISLENGTIESVNLEYALGWNFQTDGYKKIFRGDEINGFKVNRLTSNHWLHYFASAELESPLLCNKNSIQLGCDDECVPLSGIIKLEGEDVLFYPFEAEENFYFLCPRDEIAEKEFKEKSEFAFSDGKKFNVQPIGISCGTLNVDGRVTSVDKEVLAALIDMEITDEEYFEVEIGFINISFDTFSDGEGVEIYGTRAYGNVEYIEIK